ncbi:MAG TPA: hemolysin family protein [Anaerolineales bacterium]|nr:hemolysin family protein [Anaerolineales bacterium]HMV95866.1 hemolysin family protein [Anaerolineales bacterium]HMX18760.1 hemolysin family protein [Anaerolineales bacterium]HMX74759.1 hemolysin family protein [Anaerolineales bacterium]HMZ44003.1 hemolysin family protein [Anaerolineales bacterium]
MSIINEIVLILILILINALLAMSEAALVASRKVRLQQQANDGNKSSELALKLLKDPNIFLSTVQIGITLIGVLAGAVGGATISEALALALQKIPYLGEFSESISLAIVVLTITILTIWLGELVPKRLGLTSPEKIAQVVAGPMLFTSKAFSPLIKLMSKATNFALSLMGVDPSSEPPVTEEEIHLLIDQGTQAGVFEEAEQDMVEGIFSLGDSRVYSLMTPRTEVVWLDINDSIEDIREKIAECPYSRFPVRQDSLETIVGIVKSRDLLVESLSGKAVDLKSLLKPAHFIPETMFASRALELFKEKNTELLLVVDEFGGLQGLLTINDILEEIVGAMEFEEPQATQRQDGSWLLDGMLEVDEFKEIFDFESLPHEDEYETLSGFVMTSLGRVPQAADHFEWNNFRFEVIDMDGRRVDKVLVTTLPKPQPPQ